MLCCWQIVLVILYLLLLDSKLTDEGQEIWISVLLMLANVVLIIAIFGDTAFVARLKAQQRQSAPASLEATGGGGQGEIELRHNPMHAEGGDGGRGRGDRAATAPAAKIPNTDVVVMTAAASDSPPVGAVPSDGVVEVRVEDTASAVAEVVVAAVPGDEEAGQASQVDTTHGSAGRVARQPQWTSKRPDRRRSIHTVRAGSGV